MCEKVLGKREADPNSGIERNVDLGFVGDPVSVDRSILDTLSRDGIIPVVAPVGIGADGHTYNVNADTMAGAIAAELKASRFFLLTDVAGVLDKQGELMTDLDPVAIATLEGDGTISGGMIPKLETCGARGGGRRRRGGDPGWAGAPCNAAGNLYRQGRGHAGAQVGRF